VGLDTKDDAAVYRLDSAKAIVVTTDFFSPVVDDPFDFGRIAAANALSDVYAMGGRPLVALNIVAFPSNDLPLQILQRILAGGAQVTAEAGAALVGGHSIEDPEPKYGLAVVGLVHPSRVFKNVGARPGDHLLLTKPIGTGVITTAIKRRRARPAEIRAATELMATLNRAASEVLVAHARSVHAVTDVTGYGVTGHLLEMLEGSDVAAVLDASAIPILPAARRLAAEGIFPGGTRANLVSAGKRLVLRGSLAADETLALLLADAQTSGGLLAAVSPRSAKRIQAALADAGIESFHIGRVTEGRPRIVVEPAKLGRT
jgi:selenide, water dikinase